MARYKSSFCPYCKFPIQIHEFDHPKYRSPFQTCPRCKKIYIDKDSIELALDYRPVPKIETSSKILLAMGIVFFLASREYHATWASILIIALGAYLIYKDVSSYNKRREERETLLMESENRLKNKNYIIALYRRGYHIPKKYYHIIENEIESNSTHN